MHTDKYPNMRILRSMEHLCCSSSVKFNYKHTESDKDTQLSKQLYAVTGEVFLTASAKKDFERGNPQWNHPQQTYKNLNVNRSPSENSHRVARGRSSVEVFEELRRASILAGNLLPDLCRHSPAGRGEEREVMISIPAEHVNRLSPHFSTAGNIFRTQYFTPGWGSWN